MTNTEIPSQLKTITATNGRIFPKGAGSNDNGKVNKAAMANPTTNPVKPEARVWDETLSNDLRILRAGRVVKYGVMIKPKSIPANPIKTPANSGD